MDEFKIQLLGPVGVERNGETLCVGPPQQQAVLAMLLLAHGGLVPIDSMIDGLWGESPPKTAVGIIRKLISVLRSPGNPERPGCGFAIDFAGNGYVLPSSGLDIDLDRFERDVQQAMAALDDDAGNALAWSRRALALWRGSPLAGTTGPFAEAVRARVTELYLDAAQTELTAQVNTGGQAGAIARIRALTDEHPLRESLHELLMLALHKAGRPGEALDAYARARRTLRDELAIEPGPGLRAMQRRILTGGAGDAGHAVTMTIPTQRRPSATQARARPSTAQGQARSAAAQEQAPGRTPRQAPGLAQEQTRGQTQTQGQSRGQAQTQGQAQRQEQCAETPPPKRGQAINRLPPDPPDFTGRADLLTAIRQQLSSPKGSRIVGLCGTPGIGKTSLALRAGHLLAPAFPDGQIYLNLTGPVGGPMPGSEVLRVLLRSAGVPSAEVPVNPALQAWAWREHLATRRLLVVLDDVDSITQVQDALAAPSGSAFIVTGRRTLLGLSGARYHEVPELSVDEGYALLAALAGADRVGAEPDTARALVRLCAGHPLAIRELATRLTARPKWRLEHVLKLLGAVPEHVTHRTWLSGSASSAPLERAYHRLTPEQARVFHKAAAFDSAWIPVTAVAVELGMPEDLLRSLFESLADAHLLKPGVWGSYGYDPMVRQFARSLAPPPAQFSPR